MRADSTWSLLVLLAVIAAAVTLLGRAEAAGASAARPGGERVTVLVELFTSEGCSSCPPADQLLSQLVESQPIPNAEIIALSQHVDYWNRLGWRDPFSSEQFSARQSDYSRAFGRGRIYTPQMIVDGRQEFVGSDARLARTAIARATEIHKAVLYVAQSAGAVHDGLALPLDIRVQSLPKDIAPEPLDVFLATTEDDLQTHVRRGENAGRLLKHQAVVRRLQTVGVINPGAPRTFSAKVAAKIDPAWNRNRLRAVVFLQGRNTRRVFGAASTALRSH